MRYFRNQIVFAGHDVKERIDESLLSAHNDWTDLIIFQEPLECYRITRVSTKNKIYHLTPHYNPFYQHHKMIQGYEWKKLGETDVISLDDYLNYVKTFTLIKGEVKTNGKEEK